jgi:glycosyltransferase involved in cell wall biosynthesis
VYGITEQVHLAVRIPPTTDLVWCPHYNIPVTFPGGLLVAIHDVCHLALPHLIKGAHRRAYARLMLEIVKRRASRILCSSEFTTREFRRLVGGNGAVATVHLGIDPHWFAVQASERPHPRPYLLFVGNVKPHKNVGTLIKAFARIAGTIPHDLIIVGKQSGFVTGDAAASETAETLGNRVCFTGEVPVRRLEQFFAHADTFVFPSLYEGFGLPPLEAMACGCPTIVSRAASLPEVCGDAALYFDPTNPEELASLLIRVLSDAELRQELRDRGRHHAAQFSWDRAARETVAAMEQVLTQ